MAKINLGILGGFNGKVGTVVGSFWKGIPVMRAYVRNIRNRDTAAQRLVRMRFALLGEMTSAFNGALLLGLKNTAARNKMTEGNVFVKLNWDKVTVSADGVSSVDYAQMVLSQGPLDNVLFGSARFDTPSQVDISFGANDDGDRSDAEDNVYVFVYNPESKSGSLSKAAKRGDATMSIKVPAQWNGSKVHIWGFTVSNDLNPVSSRSTYIGTGTIG
ncbi:MAG: hypothetical protein IJ745_07740 [Bacteroidales bacterium]|nr:hypothetical protein [Bacteroidales bacterium]